MLTDTLDDASEASRRSTDKWHVGREIPIALMVMLLIQTGGAVWWASSMSSKLDAALQTLAEFRAERYTKDDARRDRELFMQIIESMRQRDTDLERRLGSVERQHESMNLGLKVK